MSILEAKEITTTFERGNVVANDNVNLNIEDGEFFVLLGPSGCGKSTFLRSVAGLEKPDSGEMYLKGESILGKEPAERDVAMMFQKVTLYPNMNVYDNIAFPLKIKGVDKDRIEEQVNEVLEFTQIPEKKYSNVKNLSGGEAQRAMIARVLVQDPQLFLLDEPFSSLDHQLRVHMRKEILKIHKKTGVTILFVTHNQEEAMRLGERIGIMNNGRVEQVGTPKEILREPKNKFVAQFIGHPQINFVEGKINTKNDKIYLQIEDKDYGPLEKDEIKEIPESEEVTLGIRPEKLKIEKGKIEGENKFTSEIDLVEDTGKDVYINFSFGDASLQAEVPETEEWEMGEEITFSFNKGDLRLFDESGARIK